MRSFSKEFLIISTVLLTLILFGLCYIAFTKSYITDGISMQPAYSHETKITGIRVFLSLKRFDVITYAPPTEFCTTENKQCDVVGRIIGLPGEKIEIANYFVKINDQQISEPFLAPDTKTLFSEKVGGIFHLKEDEYFIMADNRPYAEDSRIFGPIKRSQIRTKIIF